MYHYGTALGRGLGQRTRSENTIKNNILLIGVSDTLKLKWTARALMAGNKWQAIVAEDIHYLIKVVHLKQLFKLKAFISIKPITGTFELYRGS